MSKKQSLLSRDAIRNAEDLKTETISVPEWGGDILITELSGHGRAQVMDEHEKSKAIAPGARSIALEDALIIACLVDNTGAPIFTAADAEWLRSKNGVVRDRIAKAAMKLNGMGATAEVEAKNASGEVSSDASPSDSASS